MSQFLLLVFAATSNAIPTSHTTLGPSRSVCVCVPYQFPLASMGSARVLSSQDGAERNRIERLQNEPSWNLYLDDILHCG